MRKSHLKVLRFKPEARPGREKARRKKYFYAGVAFYAFFASALWIFSAFEVKKLNSEVAALLEDTGRMKRELILSIKTEREKSIAALVPERAPTQGNSLPGPALKLEGIISDGKKALAIIENALYSEGDLLDGYEITEIGADYVRLEREGAGLVLKVRGEAR